MTINVSNFPKISVITPVKNAESTLEKSIKSLISQNYPNLEYIVIYGKSEDKTSEIIKKYQNFINITAIQEGDGAAQAMNQGIKLASGLIISFLNADDFYEPNTLDQAAQAFTQSQSLDAVSFRYRVVEEKNNHYKTIEETTSEQIELNRDKIITSYGMNARFFKRNLFEKFGYIITKDDQNRNFISNDVEYLIRFTLNGIKNKVIDQIGYNYLAHQKSITFSKNLQNKVRLFEDKIFIANIFLNNKELNLPKIWQKTFKKWKIKYRSKIAIIELSNLNFKTFIKHFLKGINENGTVNFTLFFIKNIFRSQK